MKNEDIEAVRNDVRTLIRDAQTLFADASTLQGSAAEELRHRGTSLLMQALDGLNSLQQTLTVRGKQLAQGADRYVHEKPWTSMGISAGIGLLIGALIARR